MRSTKSLAHVSLLPMLGSASVLCVSAAALAQSDPANRYYQVIDLGEFRPTTEMYFTSPSINARHDVVWTTFEEEWSPRAMLRVHTAGFGFAGGQVIDLSTLGGQALGGGAADINDDGVIAGFVEHLDDVGFRYSRGFVWRLEGSGQVATAELGALTDIPYAPSSAFAVGAGTTPVIVGRAMSDHMSLGVRLYEAFRYVFQPGSFPQEVQSLGWGSDYATATAFAVAGSASQFIGGERDEAGQNGCWGDSFAVGQGAPGQPVSFLPVRDDECGANAYGVNDAGQFVGWAMRRLGDGLNCEQVAVLWDIDATEQTDLPDSLDSVASKLTSLGKDGSVSVVGGSTDAFLWVRGGDGAWTTVLLQSRISSLHDLWLNIATDITDDGWIVGQATRDGVKHAVILKPADLCPGDIDGDGTVGGGDLGYILSSFGANEPGMGGGAADVNQDGAVDGLDLSVVLSAWGVICGD